MHKGPLPGASANPRFMLRCRYPRRIRFYAVAHEAPERASRVLPDDLRLQMTRRQKIRHGPSVAPPAPAIIAWCHVIPSASRDLVCLVGAGMELSVEQADVLRELANHRDAPADLTTRARIVPWSGDGRRRKDIAELLAVSLPTVDRWQPRYAQRGPAGLEGDRPGGARGQVPARVRARVMAPARMTPLAGTGLSHWSTRELAKSSVPETSSAASHAACWYSWRMPPSRSRLRTSSRVIRAGSVIGVRAWRQASSRSTGRFFAACTTQAAVGCAVAPRMRIRRLACSIAASTCSRAPVRVTVSTRSQAGRASAWESRKVVWLRLRGAAGQSGRLSGLGEMRCVSASFGACDRRAAPRPSYWTYLGCGAVRRAYDAAGVTGSAHVADDVHVTLPDDARAVTGLDGRGERPRRTGLW